MKLQVSNMVAFILASTQQRGCISLKWFSFITSINPGYWCYPILWFLTWWRWSPFLQKFSSCPWSSLTSVPCCWTDGKSSKLKLPKKTKLGQNVFCRLNGSIWCVSTSAGGNKVRNKIFIPNFFPVSKEEEKTSLYLKFPLGCCLLFMFLPADVCCDCQGCMCSHVDMPPDCKWAFWFQSPMMDFHTDVTNLFAFTVFLTYRLCTLSEVSTKGHSEMW